MIDSKTEWTQEILTDAWDEITIIAKDFLEIDDKDLFINQFELVTAEQMIDAYASIGLPIHYNHWSFGKDFITNKRAYDKGDMSLAYELVINSNPCVNLLMEENPAYMQIMVMAHAGVGHNAVFKNNAYFNMWTEPNSIIDHMKFVADYVRECELKYGSDVVEGVLDSIHSISQNSINLYPVKDKIHLTEDEIIQKMREQDEANAVTRDYIIEKTTVDKNKNDGKKLNAIDEENLALFIAKNSPNMKDWVRNLLIMISKIEQYFSPQGVTKILNEGYATFCHYHIMSELERKGIISHDAYIAFLTSHGAVIFQPNYFDSYYSGFNPYALGFAIFQDIKRICENPTDEDREYMGHLIGKRWQDAVKDAAFNYRDDSFIEQFLSPKVIRDFRMFNLNINRKENELAGIVTEICDRQGYKNIKNALAKSRQRISYVPKITVHKVNLTGDRHLHLLYHPLEGRELDKKTALEVTQHIGKLWGYQVNLHIGD